MAIQCVPLLGPAYRKGTTISVIRHFREIGGETVLLCSAAQRLHRRRGGGVPLTPRRSTRLVRPSVRIFLIQPR